MPDINLPMFQNEGLGSFAPRTNMFDAISYSRKWWRRNRIINNLEPVANRVQDAISGTTERNQEALQRYYDTEIESFTDFDLRNMREAYVEQATKELESMYGSLDNIKPKMKNVRNMGDLQKNFQRYRKSMADKKRLLKEAETFANENLKARLGYNLTNYEKHGHTLDSLYADFDNKLNERRAQYAETYGTTYDELEDAFFYEFMNDESREFDVGKWDIDAQIIADMIGSTYDDVTAVHLFDERTDETGPVNFDFTEEWLNNLRESSVTSQSSIYESLNQISDKEDQSRMKAAMEMSQTLRGKEVAAAQQREESTAQNIKTMKKAEEESRRDIEEAESAMLNLGGAGGRKVQAVDFLSERPK